MTDLHEGRRWYGMYICSALSPYVVADRRARPGRCRCCTGYSNRRAKKYFYNKNNEATATAGSQTSVNDYVDMFINYRLKVQAALDEKLDTLSSFKKEFSGYRDAQLRPRFAG